MHYGSFESLFVSVGQTVTQMDEATQQDAALVEKPPPLRHSGGAPHRRQAPGRPCRRGTGTSNESDWAEF
ncbi:hypothetical protein XHC_2217 [Xanthomonas hortorum pv. carotae str. M081]|nr:hypothetical protein XHC_2217 [Xanthomonas hortorum pv. carotae str. M081]